LDGGKVEYFGKKEYLCLENKISIEIIYLKSNDYSFKRNVLRCLLYLNINAWRSQNDRKNGILEKGLGFDVEMYFKLT